MPVVTRIKQALRAWNAFQSNDDFPQRYLNTQYSAGASYGSRRPDRPTLRYTHEKTIISSIYTRISVDVAQIPFRHIKIDDQERYSENIKSTFAQCLDLEPNIDQGPRAFRQDIINTVIDKGVAAIVPVDTVGNPEEDSNPLLKKKRDILTLRVGDIVGWYPKHVRISLYNEAKGLREEIILEKSFVAIVENPLYAVMNEPNSTLQRLLSKLRLLDIVDEQSSSGKLDLIIQLPYVIKTEARREQADKRRVDIEMQLKGSKYGIAYTDATEKITQLNRPAENNLLKQVELLTTMLYDQLGITETIMNGTADEATMINYYNRTVQPLLDSVKEAMQRSFIGADKTDKGERVWYFRDPFKLIPLSQIADIADKFSRNEILSPNEIRGAIGVVPSKDPNADKLMNSNMPQIPEAPPGPSFEDMDSVMNDVFNGLKSDLDKMVEGKA